MRCTVEGCPWPDDPHIPWCGGIPDHGHTNVATHQHLPKKGMGGRNPKSKIVALLCPAMHDLVDNGTRYKNEVIEWEWRRFYRLWDTQNDHRFEGWSLIWRQLDDRTPVTARPPDADIRRVDTSLVRYLQEGPGLDQDADDAGGLKEYGDDLPELIDGAGQEATDSNPTHHLTGPDTNWRETALVLPWGLSLEQWKEKVYSLGRMHRSVGFWLGDALVYGEDYFGEDVVWAVVDELGLAFETLANYASVCRAIPPDSRRRECSYAVHAEVAPVFREDAQKGQEWLSRAEAEGLSSRNLRRLLRPSVERERKCCKP